MGIFTDQLNKLLLKVNPGWRSLLSYSDYPQAVRMNRNFKTYAKEGYKNSDTLYKCISYLIRNGSAIPPVLYTDNTKKERIEKHPLLDKLNKPNNEQTGVAYREAVLGYKLLAGNSFQYAIRSGKAGPPDELWPLRPDKVQILIVGSKGIIGYKYEDLEGTIDPANIGHTKYWNPDDDNEKGMGLSPVEAASLNIDMQIAAKKWNLGLLQNGARPPGIWKIPGVMGPNERQQLENKLNEKFTGSRGAGKSPLFDNGVDWTPTGLAPGQMDYLDSLKYNGGSIANILNMAPQLVGDTSSSTYDNMEQAKVWSYTEGIFPELDDLYALWNIWLLPMYSDLAGSGAYLYYDKESVEVIQKVLQTQKDAQTQRANNLWINGICSQNEARILAGLPETTEGDVYRIGEVLVPQGKLQEYAEQSIAAPPDPTPAKEEPLALPQTTVSEVPGDEPQKQLSALIVSKAINLRTSEEKQAHKNTVESLRAKWETKATRQLQDYFKSEQEAVVSAIHSAAFPGSAYLRVEHALTTHSPQLEKVLLKIYQDVGEDFGAMVYQQIQERSKKSFDLSSLLGTLKSIVFEKVQYIIATTKEKIHSIISAQVDAGSSLDALSSSVSDLYSSQFIPNRSEDIASTEVCSASNIGSMQAASQTGVALKKVWVALDDHKTRQAHAEADGQEVGMDDQFLVGGEKLSYPGDPSGSAGNIINCRCTLSYTQDTTKQRVHSRDEYKQFVEAVLL